MPYIRGMLIILAILLTFSCSSDNQKMDKDLTVNRAEKATHVLKDSVKKMGSFRNIEPVDDSTSYILDGNGRIHHFVNYRQIDTYKNEGKGPCEYQGFSDFSASHNYIFIHDSKGSRITAYDKDFKCIGSIQDSLVSRTSSIEAGNDSTLYLSNTSISSRMNPQTRLLWKILWRPTQQNYRKMNLPLQLADLKAQLLSVPLGMSPSPPLETRDESLYAVFPLAQNIYHYDIANSDSSLLPIEVDITAAQKAKDAEGLGKISKAMNKVELIYRFRILEDEFVTISKKKSVENSPWFAKFYTKEGQWIDSLRFNEEIIDVDEEHIKTLSVGQGKYPYQINEYSYRID